MPTTSHETCRSVRQLTDVLSRLGDALARPDLSSLLAAEPLLEELSGALAGATASSHDRAELLPLLREAQLALRRTTILGESLMQAAAATGAAIGATGGYDRGGRTSRREAAGALQTRG